MSPTAAATLTVQEGAVKTEGGSEEEEEEEAADEDKTEDAETEKTGEFDVLLKDEAEKALNLSCHHLRK